MSSYVELAVTTNFTFLTGASHPEELVERAGALGHAAIAVTDTNTFGGLVRAHLAAKETGVRLVVGCRLLLEDEGAGALQVLVYPTDRAAYGRLCRLLTLGKRRAEKGECRLSVRDLLEHQEGLLAAAVPPKVWDDGLVGAVENLRQVFDDDRLSIAASYLYGPDDQDRLGRIAALCRRTRVPMVATNDVHYHLPECRDLQDVLTCIRLGCTLEEAGLRLNANAERHLKPPEEMARLFRGYPAAIARTVEIARRATFSLDELRYEYPDEVVPSGKTAMEHLEDLTWRGAQDRYPGGLPEKVVAQIRHELGLIADLNYAHYFLTVHDIVVFARSLGILCQGRGAAANSAVCYCLGITSVDPDRINILFERFISKERNEPPDIDIDFEHERREEVIQYLYNKYGRERAALTAEVITYRGRSAVREVGKALGLSLDCVDRLAKAVEWWDAASVNFDRLRELGLNPEDPTIQRLIRLTAEIIGFPRHRSQHVGGFVLTRGLLCESVPIENAAMPERTVIEWDKDDIDALGMMKVDVLGLGMLSCIRKCFELVGNRRGRQLTLATVPPEDPAVYDMICHADTVGVFQIESRAQMSMLPRLRPRCFYDLVIEVAIVRPGPIQGKMVHPYLRRRNLQEAFTYPDERVKEVLGRTLGVPLFQEQAMALAIHCAGFTPGEADRLRRAIVAWKTKEIQIQTFGRKIVEGMTARGYPQEFAERCFEQIKGFSEYGFPESHAASFALLVYVSAWLKYHYPAEFACALINSQPMGFYAPAQIVRDAQDHGVEVRPVDVNISTWDCTLEKSDEVTKSRSDVVRRDPASSLRDSVTLSLRLGMRLVKGLSQADADAIAGAVGRDVRFSTIDELKRTSGVRVAALRRLASADAFASMGLDRQHALWQVRELRNEELPLLERCQGAEISRRPRETVGLEPLAPRRLDTSTPSLPHVPLVRSVFHDYSSLGLSLKAHPISFIRPRLAGRQITHAIDLKDPAKCPNGREVSVAGIVLVRQRPGTASGVVFMTLEDETGSANLVVWPKVYAQYRREAGHSVAIIAHGTVQREGEVVHIVVKRVEDISGDLPGLAPGSRDFH